jgi:hypothetical protein
VCSQVDDRQRAPVLFQVRADPLLHLGETAGADDSVGVDEGYPAQRALGGTALGGTVALAACDVAGVVVAVGELDLGIVAAAVASAGRALAGGQDPLAIVLA